MKKRIIAPKLNNGDIRIRSYGRLPPKVKESLRLIAKDEGKYVKIKVCGPLTTVHGRRYLFIWGARVV